MSSDSEFVKILKIKGNSFLIGITIDILYCRSQWWRENDAVPCEIRLGTTKKTKNHVFWRTTECFGGGIQGKWISHWKQQSTISLSIRSQRYSGGILLWGFKGIKRAFRWKSGSRIDAQKIEESLNKKSELSSKNIYYLIPKIKEINKFGSFFQSFSGRFEDGDDKGFSAIHTASAHALSIRLSAAFSDCFLSILPHYVTLYSLLNVFSLHWIP